VHLGGLWAVFRHSGSVQTSSVRGKHVFTN
jgi:hypothetical protein